MACPNCKTKFLFGMARIMIPPAGVKSFGDPDLRYLWRSIPARCKEIREIVSIGYRFANSDSEMEMLFRSLTNGRLGRDIPIALVNPHPKAVKARFKSIFDQAAFTTFPSMSEFLET